jgi:hypothetical protein
VNLNGFNDIRQTEVPYIHTAEPLVLHHSSLEVGIDIENLGINRWVLIYL